MEDDHTELRRMIEQRDFAFQEILEAWRALNEFGILNNDQTSLADAIRKLFAHSEPSEINALLAEKIAKEERKDKEASE